MSAKMAPRRGNSGPPSAISPCAYLTPELRWAAAIAVLPFLLNLHLLFQFYAASPIYLYSGLTKNFAVLAHHFPTLDFNVGVLSEAQGRRATLDIFSGLMPWWNSYEGVGAPLAGNMQSAALFPPTLLLALPDGILYLHLLLQSVAGVFTYLLMRRLDVSPFSAFTAAVLFEFNGTFAWLPTEPIAFLPMLLYGVELEMAQISGAWRWIAAACALSLYAGFPEMAYIDGLLVSVWTVVRLATEPAIQWRKSLLRIALGVFCGLLLASPVLIAFADYLAVGAYSLHANGFLGKQHLEAPFAVNLALPYLFGLLFKAMQVPRITYMWCLVGGYTGLGLLTLGLMGIAGRRHRSLRMALLFWLVFCAIAAYGLPGAHLLVRAAFLYNAAFFRYFDPSLIMALAVLTGLALDDVVQGISKRAYYLPIILMAVFLAIGIVSLRHSLVALHHPFWLAVSVAMALFVLGGVALARNLPALWCRRVAGAIIIAEALFNFLLPSFDNPRHPALELGGVQYLKAHLGDQRVYAMGPLEPNYGSYFGIAEIDDCDFPIPANWLAYRQKHLDPYAGPLLFDGHVRQSIKSAAPTPGAELALNLANYEAVGVRYVLTKPDAALPASLNLPKVYTDSVMSIYELPKPRPYFDAPDCEITPVSRNEVVSDCAAASTLTRLELFLPGWHASVNNLAVPVSVTGDIFQQVTLPPGRAQIRFYFRPPYMRGGYALFFAGLLLLCLPFRRLLGN